MSKQIQQIILCQICLCVMSIICPVAYLTSGNAENPMAMMSLIFVFFFIFLLSDGLVIGLAWGIGKENLKNAMVVSNILLPRRQERRAVFGCGSYWLVSPWDFCAFPYGSCCVQMLPAPCSCCCAQSVRPCFSPSGVRMRAKPAFMNSAASSGGKWSARWPAETLTASPS